jgi:hypothetical protein
MSCTIQEQWGHNSLSVAQTSSPKFDRQDIDQRPPSSGSRGACRTTNNVQMPICIECRFPVTSLYTSYSKADDRTLGKGVRLTQCPRCKRFADKYVEHDFVVLFIDLVLIKPQVMRVTFERNKETVAHQRGRCIGTSCSIISGGRMTDSK